jgi:acetyltransferase-like isoleucine patch superfamily enzyme
MSWRPRRQSSAPAFAAFGSGSVIAQPVVGIPNPEGIAVGAGVDIRAYAYLEAITAPGLVGISIGDGTYIGPFARITAFGRVTIGRHVLIADRCYLSDTGHDYEDVERPIMHQGLREGRHLRIGDGAWLGIGVAVVGDVSIGQNAVVGANSTVRDDVPPFTVVAGNPARVVRRYVDGAWQWEEPAR